LAGENSVDFLRKPFDLLHQLPSFNAQRLQRVNSYLLTLGALAG